jgi:two-component system sensor histidine kinase GlrK
VRLSIFWRSALGSLAIILVVAGVNVYALNQLRQLAALSNELVSYRYPAIEGAKRLVDMLSFQLRTEQRFLVVRDTALLREFDDDTEEFRRTVAMLLSRETSPEGVTLLKETERLHEEYHALFHDDADLRIASRPELSYELYEKRRAPLVDHMNQALEAYSGLHQAQVSTRVSESNVRAEQAEAFTQQLVIVALLLGLGLAAIASYGILRPLRRLQEAITQIGQGNFGAAVDIPAPKDLQELVQTVKWMGKRLQELDDMKSEFLAHISHELRTPLASIREGTHLLLDEIPGPLAPAQRQTLQIMADSSQRLIHLISTLLDLSKMEAGMMPYQIAPTDMCRVADNSVAKLRLLAESRHIRILTEARDGALWVAADATRIEQVLDNLLSNAIKFSPAGGVVSLRMLSLSKEKAVQLSVSDSGPGVPSQELPHIFEKFYQGRRQRRTMVAGSGLGLAMAKKVVEAHGGRIWAESEPGKGATFHVVLPVGTERGLAAGEAPPPAT